MNRALVGNAADKEQTEKADWKATDLRKRQLEDLRAVLEGSFGRRFVWRYLGLCGVFHSSFAVNAEQTAFNEGQRNIGLQLLADVNEADPDAYAKMLNEKKAEEKRNG